MGNARKRIEEAAEKAVRLKLDPLTGTQSQSTSNRTFGCLNGDNTKIKFTDGVEAPVQVSGFPISRCGPVTDMGNGTYYMEGKKPEIISIGGGESFRVAFYDRFTLTPYVAKSGSSKKYLLTGFPTFDRTVPPFSTSTLGASLRFEDFTVSTMRFTPDGRNLAMLTATGGGTPGTEITLYAVYNITFNEDSETVEGTYISKVLNTTPGDPESSFVLANDATLSFNYKTVGDTTFPAINIYITGTLSPGSSYIIKAFENFKSDLTYTFSSVLFSSVFPGSFGYALPMNSFTDNEGNVGVTWDIRDTFGFQVGKYWSFPTAFTAPIITTNFGSRYLGRTGRNMANAMQPSDEFIVSAASGIIKTETLEWWELVLLPGPITLPSIAFSRAQRSNFFVGFNSSYNNGASAPATKSFITKFTQNDPELVSTGSLELTTPDLRKFYFELGTTPHPGGSSYEHGTVLYDVVLRNV